MQENVHRYTIRFTKRAPKLDAGFDSPDWAGAEEGVVGNFRPESSAHRPEVRFRVLHDRTRLYVRFLVCDRYVRSVNTAYQGPVCLDSCVEFFVRPKLSGGYFNFEVNAGGSLLLYYIEDPTRDPQKGFVRYAPVAEEWGRQVTIWHSQPAVIDPEVAGPQTWGIGWSAPLDLFTAHVGPLGDLSGQVWRGNFYKCADKTSHPHWASWAPVPQLNFHLPDSFGEIAIG